MFPYLDFALVSFVLFAGFGLGMLLGYLIKDAPRRSFFDGDGGELIAFPDLTEARAADAGAEIIPFPRHRAG